MSMTTLFVGMPGGMELLVVLFMMLFGFILPPVIAVFLYRRVSGSSDADPERVERLEREVERLRGQIDESRDTESE